MPVIAMFIAPLLAMYVKYALVKYSVRILLFIVVFESFQTAMQYTTDMIFSKFTQLNFPCMISYILNSLDILPMLNFGLSVWTTIYLGKFIFNFLTKLV